MYMLNIFWRFCLDLIKNDVMFNVQQLQILNDTILRLIFDLKY